MPLVKPGNAVTEKAVQTAQSETKNAVKEPEPELETKAAAAEPEPEPETTAAAEPEPEPETTAAAEPEPELESEPEPEAEPEAAATGDAVGAGGEVAKVDASAVATKSNSQAVAMAEMAEEGIEGLDLDYTSFPNVVLKDGEFQIVGTNNVMDAVKGFDAIITKTQAKYAMKVGTNDDDGDVAFSATKEAFDDPNTEVGQKVAEWRAEGLKPELKKYIEAFCMVETVHGEEMKHLEGELVVVQIAPMSCGRFSGYAVTQQAKRKAMPPQYVTHIKRGEKVTSAKFPFYPWDFKFVRMA